MNGPQAKTCGRVSAWRLPDARGITVLKDTVAQSVGANDEPFTLGTMYRQRCSQWSPHER